MPKRETHALCLTNPASDSSASFSSGVCGSDFKLDALRASPIACVELGNCSGVLLRGLLADELSELFKRQKNLRIREIAVRLIVV